MEGRQKYGFIIFAFGTILSTTLLAQQIGAGIHLQTYRHGLTQFNILDFTFFLALFFVALVFIPIGLGLIFLKTNRIEPIKKTKIFAIIFLITGLIAGLAFISALNSDSSTRSHTAWNDVERLVITAAGFNSTQNSVDVYLQMTSGNNITFVNAVIRDKTGIIVNNVPIHYSLSDSKLTTLAVNLNQALPSGDYTVTLMTVKGSSFVSPLFKIGE